MEKLWEQTKVAIDFFHEYLPLTEMKNADELTKEKNDYCLAKEGEVYAIYLPEGRSTEIMLPAGNYSFKWFNPRTGGDLLPGSVKKLTVKGYISTGNPSDGDGKDWVCLIRLSILSSVLP